MTSASNIRAGVCDAATSSAARCVHVDRFDWRCTRRVRMSSRCYQHQHTDLPDELVVLRDPRTGEPMEVE